MLSAKIITIVRATFGVLATNSNKTTNRNAKSARDGIIMAVITLPRLLSRFAKSVSANLKIKTSLLNT